MKHNIAPLRPKDDARNILETGQRPKIDDFPTILSQLALEMAQQALKLKTQGQFDLRLDAFKALTAYQAMLNKQAEGDEGGGIEDIRDQLVKPVIEPVEAPEAEGELEEEPEDGGADRS